MTPKATILRAAQLLAQDAAEIKMSHTRSDGTWDLSDPCDESAKADHDERIAIAANLKLLASLTL